MPTMIAASSVILLLFSAASALQMTSLGSSYAAGPGLKPDQKYSRIAAAALNANLTDLAVSGSTLISMASQIAKIPSDAEIISITSGGNDLGYIGGLMADSMGAGPKAPSISEEELVKRWNDDLAKIHTAAPKAKVFLVEYLTILGPDVRPNIDVPFNASRIEYHRGVATILLNGTRTAASGKDWLSLVSVAENSVGHGIGSAEPWVNGKSVGTQGGTAWHPNVPGMKAVADRLVETIKSTGAAGATKRSACSCQGRTCSEL